MIEVAKAHTIDSADASLLETLNAERVSPLALKNQLSMDEIKAGKRRGNGISADDHEICDHRIYGDWPEYHYDLSGKEVYFRPLDGWWSVSLRKAAEFGLLTSEAVAGCRAE